MTEVVLGPYRLGIPNEFGPRILSLRREGGPEMLATSVEETIQHAGGSYIFHGGHRLWASPEIPGFTYASEESPCIVKTTSNGVVVRNGVDDAGYTKEIAVTLEDDRLRVDHTLTREPGAVDGMAAWAITQLPIDGLAFLPLSGPDTAPLPNRELILWPYTSTADERLRFTDEGVEITAHTGAPIKLGTGPRRPRLGYLRDGQLFVKEFGTSTDGPTPDLGAGSQIFVGRGFCELETVGGLTDGTVATVSEHWSVSECGDTASAWETLTLEPR